VTSRDTILAAVRANQPTPAPSLPEVPLFEMRSRPLLEDFREALLRMGGKLAEWPDGENLDRFIARYSHRPRSSARQPRK
jgi:hypothetical protein